MQQIYKMHKITQCLYAQTVNVAFLCECHNETNDDMSESKKERIVREKREQKNSKMTVK